MIRRPLPSPEASVADDAVTSRHVPEERKLVFGNRQVYFGAEASRFITINCARKSIYVKVKVRQSLYMTGQALRIPGNLGWW